MEVEPGQRRRWILARAVGAGGWQTQAAHLFRIVLSHSRKGYSEGVWRQTTESSSGVWKMRSGVSAGSPQTLVIDNLRRRSDAGRLF